MTTRNSDYGILSSRRSTRGHCTASAVSFSIIA